MNFKIWVPTCKIGKKTILYSLVEIFLFILRIQTVTTDIFFLASPLFYCRITNFVSPGKALSTLDPFNGTPNNLDVFKNLASFFGRHRTAASITSLLHDDLFDSGVGIFRRNGSKNYQQLS